MSWKLNDRWLWLGFGAFLFVASKGIAHALRQTLILNEIHDPELTKAKNETHAEDSISIAALATLSASPNPDIANAAISLLLTRFAQSEAASTSLTLHLFNSNPSVRQASKRVLDLFDRFPCPPDLCPLRLDRVQKLRHGTSNPAVRTMCQAFARAFDRYRNGTGSLRAVADKVEDSVTLVRPSARLEDSFVFDEPVGFQPSSRRVESLVELLADQAAGLRPGLAAAAGPLSNSSATSEASTVSSSLELPALEEVLAEAVADGLVGRRARQLGSSVEAEARRRRREAMVLYEAGTGAIGSDNIIHPRTRTS